MRIKEISVTVSRTFNLGNYNSLRVEASAVCELLDGETAEEGRVMLLDDIRKSLREQYAEFGPKGA